MGIPEDSWKPATSASPLLTSLPRVRPQLLKNPRTPHRECGQEILQRTDSSVDKSPVEIRFQCQFPARGRTIMGRSMARLADVDIPYAVMDTFDFISEDAAEHLENLRKHVETYVDYCALQSALTENDWIAFVANDSILARRSGISDYPMDDAVRFTSPESLAETVSLPHAGEVIGMAIKPGITVIVGGGYHGKSTLLNAMQRGVYAHVPGDGRELVALVPDAMKVRAEDGRSVTSVDVSAFINDLPGGAETTSFSTENASGSTSQAASIVEAVELGCPVLLVDEDTSATNLMIRDERMRELVADDKSRYSVCRPHCGPVKAGCPVLVMGGSGIIWMLLIW